MESHKLDYRLVYFFGKPSYMVQHNYHTYITIAAVTINKLMYMIKIQFYFP